MNENFFTEDSKRKGVISSTIEKLGGLEKAIRDHLAVQHMPYPLSARVYNTGNISILDSTPTALIFNTVRRDDGGFFNAANPSRLTAPVDGWYQFDAGVEWAANATGSRRLSLQLDGAGITIVFDLRLAITTAGLSTELAVSTKYYLTAGQYAESIVYQNRGGPLNVLASPNYSPEFSMALIK